MICEYSFEENSISLYSICYQECNTRSLNTSKVYKLDALTYGVEISDDELITKSNEIIDIPVTSESARGTNPSTWSDIFIDNIYPTYTVIDIGHVSQFIAFPRSYYDEQVGRYACAITVLYHCAMFYGCVTGNSSTISSEYIELWDLTGTSQYAVQNGIILGSTDYTKSPIGFVTFGARRGVSLSSSIIANPTIETFKNCINSGNIANLSVAIYRSNGEQEGHQMTAESYMQLKNVSTNNIVNTVMVADGWNSNVRYVNLDFPDYTRIHAILFSR